MNDSTFTAEELGRIQYRDGYPRSRSALGHFGTTTWRDWAGVISPGKDTLVAGTEGHNITFTRVIAQKKAEDAG